MSPRDGGVRAPARSGGGVAAATWAHSRGPLSSRFWGRCLTIFWCSLSYIFLLSPMIVVMGASFQGGEFNTAIRFPPVEPSIQWYLEIPLDQLRALGISLALASVAALGACVIGIPAALGIVRSNLQLKTVISAIFRSPLQIPAIVSGIAFLQLFYAIGDATGLYWQGTLYGLAVGHIFVATPFVIGSVVAVLQRFDNRLEEAALILGASRFRAFRRVTLPVITPGVYAGALYGFMVSFGDVPLSIFLTAPGFVTYPVEIFFTMENDFDPSMLASGSVVIYTCMILLLLVQMIPDITSGGGLANFGGIVHAAGGDETNVAPGLDLINKLKIRKFWSRGGQTVTEYQSGDIYASISHAGWCQRAGMAGAPVATVHPRINDAHTGVHKYGWMGIMKSTTDPKTIEAAHWFMNQYLDGDYQYYFAKQSGVAPVNRKGLAQMAEDPMVSKFMITDLDKLGNFLRIDYNKVDISQWMDQWNRAIAK